MRYIGGHVYLQARPIRTTDGKLTELFGFSGYCVAWSCLCVVRWVAAVARKATMSDLAITQLMPSSEPDQSQLLSLYICRPLVDRHLEKSCI